LTRLDANGNGVLDPDEQQGPAQFLISRLQQSDPSIKAGQPISIKKVSETFTKMREQGNSGRGNDPRSGNAADEALEVELLVPGFGVDTEPIPLMGFGPTAELLAVTVTDDDKREASERMRRYDRNRDGFLTKDELSSRFAGNPMDFDRNKDGKLSESELAVRYARRREGEEEARESRRDDRRRRDEGGKVELADPYNKRTSYRNLADTKLPEGLPGFFSDRDANQDGQVTMAEYSSEWNAELISEYFGWDLNSDGTITALEARDAVESGASASKLASTPARGSDSGGSERSSSGSSESAAAAAPAAGGPIDPKLISYAERIISRYDKNKDKALTASEWESMLMNPSGADANRDGRVTVEEYARSMANRSKR
jgi:Ca2+-binding EF-hand superfamily protein